VEQQIDELRDLDVIDGDLSLMVIGDDEVFFFAFSKLRSYAEIPSLREARGRDEGVLPHLRCTRKESKSAVAAMRVFCRHEPAFSPIMGFE
jgi:hypothetical protein